MEVTGFIVQISSPKPKELKAFYSEVVGLEEDEQIGGLKVGQSHLLFDAHSEITGPNKEPARFLLNLFVADLDSEQKRLEGLGVEFVRKAGVEYWGGVISTFLDPDGNYVQLIEFRPELATG